ncbi:hypothetical protein SAMN05660662_0967 [Blastococcus aurantiacus]|uniref:Uncharacterized protein n=1 Tax=Blastococcus aurantiacus TaxID=1550231 RepID=A0A1G7I2E4_9ACTN|nr:hypothetical protein [Blastococcus aurantiacus]SDF06920.1 hypothetical protein SAMN05660662_0967 [Blastococcus aurantiacus]
MLFESLSSIENRTVGHEKSHRCYGFRELVDFSPERFVGLLYVQTSLQIHESPLHPSTGLHDVHQRGVLFLPNALPLITLVLVLLAPPAERLLHSDAAERSAPTYQRIDP